MKNHPTVAESEYFTNLKIDVLEVYLGVISRILIII